MRGRTACAVPGIDLVSPPMSRFRELRRWHVERRLLRLAIRPDARRPMVDVADALLPEGILDPESICYCAGVGEDIRFELELVRRWGARVWAFDPTPRSIAFMRRTTVPADRFAFMPVGLWSGDTTLHFSAPADTRHVSHSVMEGRETPGFDAPCRSVPSIMRELGHDRAGRLDLLKMNIEGAEHVVLGSVLDAGIRPRVIALTWEGDGAFRKAIDWTRRLRREGYAFVGRKAWFFTYVREQAQSDRR